MKKTLSVLLVIVLALCAPVYAQSENSLPDLGDKLHGFTVAELGTMDIVGADTVLFEHDKTGGMVLFISTDDKDRSFDITFRTPKLDSKGIPHVFEHACISGSEKYPSQNLFFPMLSQTYNTFVNAMTYDVMTTYPLSSLSEDQLLKLADYYLDGVFNPLIKTEERIYRREAWRYELTDADAPLTVTGTVYNEMKGTQTIENAAYYNVLDALFPDSIISNVNGGDPNYITDMDWQELVDFHDTYYHPSNALIILYGDLDYARFLEHINDEYYSKYDKAEISVETGLIPPRDEPVDKDYEFPVEASSQVNNASIISYAGVANGASFEDSIGLNFITYMMSHESSPLMQTMRKELPNANISTTVSFLNDPVTYYTIQGNGLNPEDKDLFKEIIDDSLEKLAKDGFDKDLIDATLAEIRFSNLTIPESSNLGINISIVTALSCVLYDDYNYHNNYLDAIDSISEKAYDGYFESLIEKYMVDNNHKAILSTAPIAGLAEEQAAKYEAYLQEIKDSMSDEEIAELVLATEEQTAWSMEEAPAELIENLQAVTVDSLPEETKSYEILEEERDGVSYLTTEASVADIGQTLLFLNTSAVAPEKLHFLKLYTSLISQVGTENYSVAEINTLITRYLYGFSVSAGIMDKTGDDYLPVVSTGWMSLDEDYEKCIELVSEILFKTDITDIDMIKGIVSRLKNSMRSQINSSPYMYQYTRALASSSEKYAYENFMNGFDYYQFLINAEEMLNDEPEQFIEELRAVVDEISYREGSIAVYAGSSSGIEIFNEHIDDLFDTLNERPKVESASSYDFEILSKETEAVIIDSAVQYNLLYAPLEAMGLEDSGKLQPMARLIYDAYITPQIRHGIGAYDNIVSFDRSGLVFISYRDPSITETYSVYEGLSEFVKDSGLTQEDADRYILSVYSAYATPSGELSGATAAVLRRLRGEPDDIILKTMREIKSFTIDDLVGMASAFEQLNAEGFRSTAGGAAVIDQNAKLFERIVNISEMILGDSEQGMSAGDLMTQLFGGQPDSFGLAKDYGIISGDGFEDIEEDSPITNEQLAVILLRALGIPELEVSGVSADSDDISDWARAAVGTLLAYGILEIDDDGNFNPQTQVTGAYFEAAIINIMILTGGE